MLLRCEQQCEREVPLGCSWYLCHWAAWSGRARGDTCSHPGRVTLTYVTGESPFHGVTLSSASGRGGSSYCPACFANHMPRPASRLITRWVLVRGTQALKYSTGSEGTLAHDKFESL